MSTLSSPNLPIDSDLPSTDLPVPAWQQSILGLLLDLDYHPAAIRLALADLSRWGSAECSSFIDREHKSMVEDMLPSNAWHWPVTASTDYCTWELGPEG